MNTAAESAARAVHVRPVQSSDEAGWRTLYQGYRDFYAQPDRPEAITAVWRWLMDPDHEERGLVAERAGELLGLANFRSFSRPIAASHGLFLDDLFTSPTARGSGAATALLHRLAEIARDEGATLVRWITADDNETARRLYDKEAKLTPWMTYDLPPAP